jgi:ribosomal protein S17E
MGKIKLKQIKAYSHEIMDSGIEFSENFDKNKKILGREMPSKKMRNQMAGYISRYKKKEKIEKEKLKPEVK